MRVKDSYSSSTAQQLLSAVRLQRSALEIEELLPKRLTQNCSVSTQKSKTYVLVGWFCFVGLGFLSNSLTVPLISMPILCCIQYLLRMNREPLSV